MTKALPTFWRFPLIIHLTVWRDVSRSISTGIINRHEFASMHEPINQLCLNHYLSCFKVVQQFHESDSHMPFHAYKSALISTQMWWIRANKSTNRISTCCSYTINDHIIKSFCSRNLRLQLTSGNISIKYYRC